jgi:hypothetical protein
VLPEEEEEEEEEEGGGGGGLLILHQTYLFNLSVDIINFIFNFYFYQVSKLYI